MDADENLQKRTERRKSARYRLHCEFIAELFSLQSSTDQDETGWTVSQVNFTVVVPTRGGSVARHGGSGSETRHFIGKRTYTTVLLVHPPALVHGQRRASGKSRDPYTEADPL